MNHAKNAQGRQANYCDPYNFYWLHTDLMICSSLMFNNQSRPPVKTLHAKSSSRQCEHRFEIVTAVCDRQKRRSQSGTTTERPPGQPACRPCGLEVETARDAVNIQHFSGKV